MGGRYIKKSCPEFVFNRSNTISIRMSSVSRGDILKAHSSWVTWRESRRGTELWPEVLSEESCAGQKEHPSAADKRS